MKVLQPQNQVDWRAVAQHYERNFIEANREIRILRIEKAQGKVHEEDSQRMHRFDNFKSPFSWK